MARKTRSASRRSGAMSTALWWATWPIHVVPRWIFYLTKELGAGLALGFCQGIRIAWWELKAEKVVRKYRKTDENIYGLDIWQLLRTITFDRQRNRQGEVVCAHCKLVTFEPHCHHIKHVAYHPKLAFTPSNLIGLCGSCHQAEHPSVPLSVSAQAPGRRLGPGRRARRRHLAA